MYGLSKSHGMNADCAYREKARQKLHKNAANYMEQILEAISHKTAAEGPPTSHLQNHPNKTCKTLLEK